MANKRRPPVVQAPVLPPPRLSVGRDIWRQIYPPGIYLGVQVGVVIVLAFVGIVYFGLSGGLAAGAGGHGLWAEDILSDPNKLVVLGDFFMGMVIASALLSVLIFSLLYRHERPWYIQTATAPVRPRSTVLFVVGILCLAGGMQLVVGLVIDLLHLTKVFTDYDDISTVLTSGSVVAQLLAVGIIGPIAEELCFRGLLFNRLRMRLRFMPSALISSALFGIAHLNVLQGLYAFVLGLLLAWLYHRVRSLWAPILLHMCFNTISVVSGFIFDTGLDHEVVSGLAVSDIVLFALAALAIPAIIAIAFTTRRSRFGEVMPTAPVAPTAFAAPAVLVAQATAALPQFPQVSQPLQPPQPPQPLQPLPLSQPLPPPLPCQQVPMPITSQQQALPPVMPQQPPPPDSRWRLG